MFWDDIILVTEQAEKYGLRAKFVDIGGSARPCIADYSLTIQSGDQQARFVTLDQRPFDHLEPNYTIVESEESFTCLEELPLRFENAIEFGTAFGLLERHPNPAHAFKQLFRSMKENSLLIIGATFSYPYQPDARDLWRFTPEGLTLLAAGAGFSVLESGWRLLIDADQGIREIHHKRPQEIKSVYASLTKGAFQSRGGKHFELPARQSATAKGNDLIAAGKKISAPPLQASLADQAAALLGAAAVVAHPRHSCVFLNTCYAGFLRSVYDRNQQLNGASYREQLSMIQRQCFGDSDFYSLALKQAGWEACDLVINAPALQQQWAREHSTSGNELAIALEQVRALKPEVVYCQDMHMLGKDFLAALRPLTKLIVGQIASPFKGIPLEMYDLIITSFPHFTDRFRAQGLRSEYVPLAFEPRVLQHIPTFTYPTRATMCSFVGGISPDHAKRLQMLETLAQETPIEFWGYGRETLISDSLVRARHHGEVWGLEMFSALAESKITVNVHIDAAESYANNMRLFEATGCGALLITDYKDNLNDLFEIGDEVVAYRGADECAALIKYYLHHPQEGEVIAQAGQARTLSEHTYERRLTHIAAILEDHVRRRS